jgi:hypothetical protein
MPFAHAYAMNSTVLHIVHTPDEGKCGKRSYNSTSGLGWDHTLIDMSAIVRSASVAEVRV